MSVFDQLKTRITNKEASAAIIGLGYVGLPLAHSMCNAGIKVYGLDIDQTKIDAIKAGKSYIGAVKDEWLKDWTEKGLLVPGTDFSALSEADFIIICVPTPIDEHNTPDLSYVESTAAVIAKHMKAGQIVVLESTTYPGTMSSVVKPILDQSGLEYAKDYHLAYSPERENPGSATHSTSTIPKIIGADEPEALELSQAFYEHFIENMVPVSSMATAEAAKIMENVFRSVNIALVNELKVIFDNMDLDIWEIIEAVKTKPFGYMPFYPGPGMGGHCIPIDPFYLSWKAKEHGVSTRFIELAGEINTAMPQYVVQKTAEAMNIHDGKALKGSRILIMGIAYKKDVSDQRETPAFPVMASLIEQGAEVDFYDPNIPEILPNRNFPSLTGKKSIEWNEKNLSQYDTCVIVTDHSDVDYGHLLKQKFLIVDTRNALGTDHNSKRVVKA